MGAGVGAIFRAPLAGALFTGEILYRDADLESDVIIPSAISSIIGYSVFSLSLPEDKRFDPLFDIEGAADFLPGSPLELVPLALLSIVLVLAGIGYIKVFYGIRKLFKKLPGPPHIRPAIGAALAGLIAVSLYFLLGKNPHALSTLGTGYGALQTVFEPGGAEKLGVQLLLIIVVFKILTTSLTISSGGSGGVFGPSMVIGGCLGAAVGQFCHKHFDGFLFAPTLQPQAYAVVGMAGFFAGCAHAPFSTIIMVSEMTGSYNLLLPTMWVSTLCFLLCRRWSLYEKQVANRLESPAHRGDFIIDVLEGIKVEEVYERDRKLVFIPESMSLEDIVHTIAETHQHYFPVVDTDQRVVGIFSADDVRNYLYDETIWKLALARDVMVTNILGVIPEDDLNTALQRFTALNVDELPVFDPDNHSRLLGMLRQKEAIARYNRRLMEHKQAAVE
jgi:CIC family chloride channel protein